MQNENAKMCPICRIFKPISDYGIRLRNGKNIGQGYCKNCKRKLDREYAKARSDKIKIACEC